MKKPRFFYQDIDNYNEEFLKKIIYWQKEQLENTLNKHKLLNNINEIYKDIYNFDEEAPVTRESLEEFITKLKDKIKESNDYLIYQVKDIEIDLGKNFENDKLDYPDGVNDAINKILKLLGDNYER